MMEKAESLLFPRRNVAFAYRGFVETLLSLSLSLLITIYYLLFTTIGYQEIDGGLLLVSLGTHFFYSNSPPRKFVVSDIFMCFILSLSSLPGEGNAKHHHHQQQRQQTTTNNEQRTTLHTVLDSGKRGKREEAAA
ncbi:hypothetical protein GGR50DRAFT_669552 [Xylaria sp. CBS 124048]|nr:hypothetical protein GGR50DRAFT_669552 [Xylaria sp. CBS 124048]